MSRKPVNLFVAAFVGCLVVGSTIAWSNIPRPVAPQVTATTTTEVAQPALDQPTTATVMPRLDAAPMLRTKADFDQAFADLTVMQRPENTPAYREKLRRVGWTRIIGSR
jgi:hypothetical protein